MNRVILTLALLLFVFSSISQANQSLQFEVHGHEFRKSKIVPSDNQGLGYIVNAWDNYQAKCDALAAQLPNDLAESFVSFSCGTELVRQTAKKSNRRQYGSTATLVLNLDNLVVKDGELVSGPHIKTKDFRGDHPWQQSRAAARQGHADACLAYQTSLKELHADNLVFVDCGVKSEKGVRDGWHYTSTAKYYLKADVVPPTEEPTEETPTTETSDDSTSSTENAGA